MKSTPRPTQEERDRITLWIREWILAGEVKRGSDTDWLDRLGQLWFVERVDLTGTKRLIRLYKGRSGWVFTGGKNSFGPAVRAFSSLDKALEAANVWVKTHILRLQ